MSAAAKSKSGGTGNRDASGNLIGGNRVQEIKDKLMKRGIQRTWGTSSVHPQGKDDGCDVKLNGAPYFESDTILQSVQNGDFAFAQANKPDFAKMREEQQKVVLSLGRMLCVSRC